MTNTYLVEIDGNAVVWVALWHHRHGTDVSVFDHEPEEEEAIIAFEDAGGEYEPERDEYIEIRGPLPLNGAEL